MEVFGMPNAGADDVGHGNLARPFIGSCDDRDLRYPGVGEEQRL
jgi:hypothetical protein